MLVITGGAGFIGSVLLGRLNNLGRDDILVVDDLGQGKKWKNLAGKRYLDFIHKDRFIEQIRKDSLQWELDAIVHLGACSSTTEKDANYLMENNFHYSRDLCLYALEHDARFINASSAATFGDGKNGFTNTARNIERLRPLNMYGYSKQIMDLWLLEKNFTSQVASLKFFNVYGPNEYHKGSMRSVALKFYEEIRNTGSMRLFASNMPGLADGEQKRDFVYVEDCAALIAWFLRDGKDINGIFNVGTGRAASFNNVAETIFKVLGKKPEIKYVPMPENISGQYQNYTCADMTWLAERKCPVKFRNVEAGIGDYVTQYLEKGYQYA